MPKKEEEALRREGRKRGYTGRRLDRFVYGTMNNQGVMHGNKVVKGAHHKKKKKKR